MLKPARIAKVCSVVNPTEQDVKLHNGYILRPIARYPEAKLRVQELTPELLSLIEARILTWELVDVVTPAEVEPRTRFCTVSPLQNNSLTPFQRKKIKLVESIGCGLRIPYL